MNMARDLAESTAKPTSSNTRPIDSRLQRLGAKGTTCWHVDAVRKQLIASGYRADLEVVVERAKEVAVKALQTQAPQASIVTSPEETLIVAHPIPGRAQAITVAFPIELSELSEEATGTRFALVEQLAKEQSSESQKSLSDISPPTNEQPASTTPGNVPSTASEPQPAAALAWSELRKLLLARVSKDAKAFCRSYKAWSIATAAMVVCGLLPWPHKIHCDVVCEPMVRRYVAAPFDGIIARSHVMVGQQVSAGDLLATLDGSDLRSELAALRAKHAQESQQQLAALATGDHAKAEHARHEVEHTMRRMELLEHRQQDLEVRSPIDGIVVTGDLERAIGAPVRMGDNLFEVAKLDAIIAEVAVPESEISYVTEDLDVAITLDAVRGKTLHTKLHRMHMRSELQENQSVFIAECNLENTENVLRPGMSGRASIAAGYQPIAWLLLHRPYESLRQWIGW